jgi:hypothetical protein
MARIDFEPPLDFGVEMQLGAGSCIEDDFIFHART